MNYIKCKNWPTFQQYKDRDPKWIKLHRSLLDNYEYSKLPDAQKSHVTGLWLLAARLDNKIPSDPAWIGKQINASSAINLSKLSDFIELYNSVQNDTEGDEPCTDLQPRVEESREDKRREETEKKHPHGELGKVLLTEDEYKKLQSKHEPQKLSRAIEILDGYIAAKKPKYASHYAVFKADSWLWERLKELEGTTRDWRGDMSTVPTFEELRKEQQGGKR